METGWTWTIMDLIGFNWLNHAAFQLLQVFRRAYGCLSATGGDERDEGGCLSHFQSPQSRLVNTCQYMSILRILFLSSHIIRERRMIVKGHAAWHCSASFFWFRTFTFAVIVQHAYTPPSLPSFPQLHTVHCNSFQFSISESQPSGGFGSQSKGSWSPQRYCRLDTTN